MPNLPWWGWVIVLLILIGLFPGLYHLIVSHLQSGVQTVCSQCTGGG